MLLRFFFFFFCHLHNLNYIFTAVERGKPKVLKGSGATSQTCGLSVGVCTDECQTEWWKKRKVMMRSCKKRKKKKTRMKVKEPMVSGLVQDKPNWFILLTATHWILKPHGPGLKDRKQRT